MAGTCELSPDPPRRETGSASPSVQRERHLVVVDDDTDTREVLAVLLGSAGYHVDVAATGKEALAHMAALPRPPDLALIDIIMPEMSGYDVIRAMRRSPALAGVPVMVISGGPHDLPEEIEIAAWLDKPPSMSDLLDTVASVVH